MIECKMIVTGKLLSRSDDSIVTQIARAAWKQLEPNLDSRWYKSGVIIEIRVKGRKPTGEPDDNS